MHATSRRTFLGSAAAATLSPSIVLAAAPKIRIGAFDDQVFRGAKLEMLRDAAKVGFDGIQVNFGEIHQGKMQMDSPEMVARYLEYAKQYNIAIVGTAVWRDYLLDTRQVATAIRLTKALHTNSLLLPFFVSTDIKTPKDMANCIAMLREMAPEAAKEGITMALENSLSAEDNLRLIERTRAPNVKVFYDVGNTVAEGFDPVKEIRFLGKDRICQFHFKDEPHYLGEGNIQFPLIVQAIRDIKFTGDVILATKSPSGNFEADAKRNLAYTRKLFAQT